ncbi:hypothetical protein B0H13DRAFT_2306297 [Mycena leptocephala]|nr:hypothetical protein B0H13DRAFT_2306297 [Mycena leptocephala]
MSHQVVWFPESRTEDDNASGQHDRGQSRLRQLLKYDIRQPAMGVYNAVTVGMLAGRPYGEHWNQAFKAMDLDTLYKLGLRSTEMFNMVASYVRQHGPDSCHIDELRSGGPFDHLSRLPVDLFSIIFRHTKLGTRINLSRASRKFRALCARELQASVNRLLKLFYLSHMAVRFMQTATRAVICGASPISYLFDSSSSPDTLEFLVPITTYSAALRFFAVATVYKAYPSEFFEVTDGILHSTIFRHLESGRTVIVSCSSTDSAIDPIPYSPFSHLFGCVTHYGLWLAYPHTASSGISFPNRSTISFVYPDTEHRLGALLRKVVSHFRVRLDLNRRHTCGSCFECPMTPRTTSDAGCMNLFFPAYPLGADASTTSVYPSEGVMGWSLDARACPHGVQLRGATQQMGHCRDDYRRWKVGITKLIRKSSWEVVMSSVSRK